MPNNPSVTRRARDSPCQIGGQFGVHKGAKNVSDFGSAYDRSKK